MIENIAAFFMALGITLMCCTIKNTPRRNVLWTIGLVFAVLGTIVFGVITQVIN